MNDERKLKIINHYKQWIEELRSIHNRWLNSGMDHEFSGATMDSDLDVVCTNMEHKIRLKIREMENEETN